MKTRSLSLCALAFPIAVGLGILAGCTSSGAEPSDAARAPAPAAAPAPNEARVVTADIEREIREHIRAQERAGRGFFHLPYEDEELRLKLVRVHTEYLASLGPNEQFACVDLVNEDGNVYDVDFFLEGGAEGMVVTETIVHKLNGKPFYVWEQGSDGTWSTVDVDDATRPLLGVVEGEDRFEFTYEFTLPELADGSRMWLPLPETDRFQTVELLSSQTPVDPRLLRDSEHGNAVMYFELDAAHSGETVRFVYDVHRLEKSAYRPDPSDDPDRYLRAERFVPDDLIFHTTANEVLAGVEGDLMRARALYDHVIDSMEYIKVGDEYGKGDALYACDSLSGNCTDYHSYFIALARAAGIPARFAIGSPVASERDAGRVSGYHCWAEFYADGQWWPVDLSESDKYSALSTYYFGRHPANRIELSRGRDLVVSPGPESGPINFLAYPVIESAGKQVPLKPYFSFYRKSGCEGECCEQVAGR